MKKFLKRSLIALISIVVLLVITVQVVLYFYKDDIKAMVDEAIAENVNAQVYYDSQSFGLSFFRSFG